MCRISGFIRILCLLQLSFHSSLSRAQGTIKANDLAFALPLTARSAPSADWDIKGRPLFPKAFYERLVEAYQATSVGSAFREESPLSTWRVVSARIAVCAPLGKTPSSDTEELCWPELRLVWQPIQRKIRLHEIYMEASADDRAVHAIYPLDPQTHLPASEAARAKILLQKLKTASSRPEAMRAALKADERREFMVLQQKLVRMFVKNAFSLRSPQLSERSYQEAGMRPEHEASASEELAFSERFKTFLRLYADPLVLAQLTAFSLPGGREPAHLDEWIFLNFLGEAGTIRPEPMDVFSARDGRRLLSLPGALRGSMLRDDERIYDLLETSQEATELQQSLLLFDVSDANLKQKLSDREQLLVANTSCVSCHKLNDLRFDFHNFGYLEDRSLTISPRVLKDVAWDLRWLKQHGIGAL